jgi:hypothetical protein
MKRLDLWDVRHAASQRMVAALAVFEEKSTPANRAKAHAAIQQFMECLPSLIGQEAACRYQASWRRFEDAAARAEQLFATLAGRPHLDATDAALMRDIEEEAVESGKAFEREQLVLQALLDDAAKVKVIAATHKTEMFGVRGSGDRFRPCRRGAYCRPRGIRH